MCRFDINSVIIINILLYESRERFRYRTIRIRIYKIKF